MNRADKIAKLRELMAVHLELDVPHTLSESDRIYEDLNVDSIMVLQLIVYLEEEWGVSFPEDEVDPAVFQTVGSLADFIEQLQDADFRGVVGP